MHRLQCVVNGTLSAFAQQEEGSDGRERSAYLHCVDLNRRELSRKSKPGCTQRGVAGSCIHEVTDLHPGVSASAPRFCDGILSGFVVKAV